jgi:hypothetical protein
MWPGAAKPMLLSILLLVGVLLGFPGNAEASVSSGTPPDLSGAAATGASSEASPLPADSVLEARNAVVGEIVIRVGDIFDTSVPGEDRSLFRLANRLHPRTRPWVIRQQLLFETGSPYSRRVLDETERLLRSRHYLYDAQIRPLRVHGGAGSPGGVPVVDVEVVVKDVWTLTAGAGFGRSGGENSTRLEVQDGNFLGTGKDVTLEQSSDVDRDSFLVRYRDSNLAGTRGRLEAWWSENSDGSRRRLDVERPFYSLEARWAAGLLSLGDDRIDRRYLAGEVTDRFRHQQDRVELYGGLSKGFRGNAARRWTVGLTWLTDRFQPVAAQDSQDLPGTRVLPEDRRLAYPWVGFERVEDEYREERDLDHIQRTEDLDLGARFAARLGWSTPLLGADRERAVWSLAARNGYRLAADRFLLVAGEGSGRWGSAGVENLRLGGRARFYWRDLGGHLFLVDLAGDLAEKLDRDRQLLLGGDSGLRGYPLRFQDGDRRVLVTLEQRLYTNWEILHLVRVGGAVFFDAGRAWFSGGGAPSAAELQAPTGWLRDVGLGLRLSSSRSGRGTVLHLDVAFPLDGGNSISDVQWLVTSKETF